MTTKELMASLRVCSDLSVGCDGCIYPNGSGCVSKILAEAANRLEALSAELEAERHRHDRYVDFELAEAAELAKVEAERDNLKREVELLRSHVTELEEDWVFD